MALTDIDDAHVSRIPDLERWLDDLADATYVFDPDFPLDQVDTIGGLTNQARFIALDEDVVDRYVADYERGDIFPAIVLRRIGDAYIPVGGNHRTAAARRADRTGHPAYVVTCSDDAAHLLAIEDNRRHGLPLTDEERIHHAAALVDAGSHTIAEAAEACGVALPKLRNVIASHRARNRCARLELRGWVDFSTTTLAKLDALPDDEVFAALADALASGAVLAREVTDIVARLRERDTVRDALAFLHDYTGGAEGRVRPPTGHPPSASRHPRARLLIDLDRVITYEAAAVAADCSTPEQGRQLANQLRAAKRRIDAILTEVEK